MDRVIKVDLGKRPSISEKIYSGSENTKQLPPDLVKKGAKQQEKEHKQLDLKEEEQMWKQVIEPKNVDISQRTKLVDALRPSCMTPREHRPERVNKTIELFNKTVQEIKDKLDADYLPKELKDEMVETTLSLSLVSLRNVLIKLYKVMGITGAKGEKLEIRVRRK